MSDTSHARLRGGQNERRRSACRIRVDDLQRERSNTPDVLRWRSGRTDSCDPNCESRRDRQGRWHNFVSSQLGDCRGNKFYKLESSHVLEVDRLLFIDVPDGGDASLDELAKPHQCPGPVAEGGAKRARISPLKQQRQTCTINIKKVEKLGSVLNSFIGRGQAA